MSAPKFMPHFDMAFCRDFCANIIGNISSSIRLRNDAAFKREGNVIRHFSVIKAEKRSSY